MLTHRMLIAIPILALAVIGTKFISIGPTGITGTSGAENPEWSLRCGEPVPNLRLQDHRGNSVEMADLQGKVVFLEYVGMACPACQSLSGADEFGSFGNVAAQPGLGSVKSMLRKYGRGTSIHDSDLMFVQLLLFDLNNRVPNADSASDWASHFNFDEYSNHVVLQGTRKLQTEILPSQIPGFVLIDKMGIVRSMSRKSDPLSFYNKLLPMVPSLLRKGIDGSSQRTQPYAMLTTVTDR